MSILRTIDDYISGKHSKKDFKKLKADALKFATDSSYLRDMLIPNIDSAEHYMNHVGKRYLPLAQIAFCGLTLATNEHQLILGVPLIEMVRLATHYTGRKYINHMKKHIRSLEAESVLKYVNKKEEDRLDRMGMLPGEDHERDRMGLEDDLEED